MTGVSRTPKRFRKKVNKKLLHKATQQATAEAMTELLARLVSHWSLDQINSLSRKNGFVCIDLGNNCYRIGKFNLQGLQENQWAVKDLDNRLIHNFYVKQAAVFYCLYETQAMFKKSMEFLQNDRNLGNVAQEVAYLTHKLTQARKKADNFATDLYLARLSAVRPLLENLQTNMQKTITVAKYSKHVWEPNHETARYSNKTNVSKD